MQCPLRQFSSSAAQLRKLLESGELHTVPCAHDALSARLIERARFPAVFVSGFCVAAARGLPDTQLTTFSEMLDSVTSICDSVSVPVFADGDNGHGNAKVS